MCTLKIENINRKIPNFPSSFPKAKKLGLSAAF
jgi:hypothetical protein